MRRSVGGLGRPSYEGTARTRASGDAALSTKPGRTRDVAHAPQPPTARPAVAGRCRAPRRRGRRWRRRHRLGALDRPQYTAVRQHDSLGAVHSARARRGQVTVCERHASGRCSPPALPP